ncbi:MAG: UDP-N-acetylglucosamine 1-carboxyvinyltransferase [Bacilli bacterium]|nr:UDP-N-acetylglucosamine 1-carboxyvinyltransferase [Bacilli bacterium]
MKQIIIEGGYELSGTIPISGMKNSVVALLPAAILSDEETSISNVPNISDKAALIEIIKILNGKVTELNNVVTINSENIISNLIPENLANKLRASYYFMGALLGRKKHVEIYFPGGCNIGNRKIDYHIKGFEALGAKIKEENGKCIIHADRLIGATIPLEFASVGATINIMLAAVKAEGVTEIQNAAKEPDVINIANFLNNMGAKITGAGTNTIKIEGVNYLHKAKIEVFPDRIEAGTYLILGALIGKNLTISNIIPSHIEALLEKLQEAGVTYKLGTNEVFIENHVSLKSINVTTAVYPGFVTDWGQPLSTLLTQCSGVSIFEETIYENRMGHVPYLNRMGANMIVEDRKIYITGKTELKGTDVIATDLRAGASLMLAGLIANGITKINNAEHILRGYEKIVEKLSNVGAKIQIVDIE